MEKIAIIESLKNCLGKRLISAKRRLYELEGGSLDSLDLAEIVLVFDAPDSTRYFSWEQVGDEFELSVCNGSHLIDEPRPDIQAESDILLSKSLGKRLTLFELYADEIGSMIATLLHFETEILVVAVGYDEWNVEKQNSEFRFFSGDDLFLWTAEEFVDALSKQKLKVAARLEVESFAQ